MTLTIILILIVVAIQTYATIENFKWSSRLAEKELDLDKQEVSLDEREKRNKEDFLALASMEDEQEVHASYTVTESDLLKYTTEAKILSIAKNKIAHTLAYDIMHKYVPSVDEVDGKMRVSYKFKIKEAE